MVVVGLAWPGRVQRPTIQLDVVGEPRAAAGTRRSHMPSVTPIIARGIPLLRHDPEVAAHA
jgi:hypothetical protein